MGDDRVMAELRSRTMARLDGAPLPGHLANMTLELARTLHTFLNNVDSDATLATGWGRRRMRA